MAGTHGRPRWLFPYACLAVAAVLGSCGGDDRSAPPDPVASVLVDPPTVTLAIGEGMPFTAATVNAAGDTLDPACVYLGTLAGSPPTDASGTVTCQGGGFNFAGTWSLSRNPPPALGYPSPPARR
jgi:hypothetical protein